MKKFLKSKTKIKPRRKKVERVFAESAVLVLLEDMRDDIKLIAEGHSGLVNGIADIKTDLTEFKAEMMEFKTEMTEFKAEMTEFKAEMKEFKAEMTEFKNEMMEFKVNTEKNFQTVFSCLSRIDEELNDIRSELMILRQELKKKVDLDRWEKLEKRVAFLEKQQLALKQNQTNIPA